MTLDQSAVVSLTPHRNSTRMAGSKKFRSRTSQQITGQGSSAIISDSDQSLVNDLLTQLDSRDHVVQAESASILETMHLDEKADIMESLLKQDSKSRFKTRQVTFYRFSCSLSYAENHHVNRPERQQRLPSHSMLMTQERRLH
jgi:hypothetical protein